MVAIEVFLLWISEKKGITVSWIHTNGSKISRSLPFRSNPERGVIHVTDLCRAHLDALRYLRSGGQSLTLNCGYGRGFSVLGVLDTVKRVSVVDFPVVNASRRQGDPAQIVAEK
jgi:nucleoside-diphosphate-sugar epimerase